MKVIDLQDGKDTMNERRLNENLTYHFGLIHMSEDWIAPILKAVEETCREEAAFVPGEGVSSIWEIVAHVTGWMEDLLYELTGSPEPGAVDWPTVDDKDPDSWRKTQEYLRTLIVLLRDHLSRLDDAALGSKANGGGGTRAERIAGILVHNSYHAGQIIKLRQIYHATKARAEGVSA